MNTSTVRSEIQPDASQGPKPRFGRNLSVMEKLTAVALVGMSPLLVFGMMIVGGSIDRIALACGASALIAAALVVATGRRWAPLLAAVPGALTFAVAGRFIFQSLFTPRETVNFGFWVVLMVIMGVATVASLTGTAQNYLRAERPQAPAWVASILAAIGALGLGAIIVAALPQPALGVEVQPEALMRLPAISSKDFKFDKTEMRVKVGDTITVRMENVDKGPHSLDVDELGLHAPMPSGKTSLAIFKADAPGQYTFYCAIGTHRQAGMVGTLIVEP